MVAVSSLLSLMVPLTVNMASVRVGLIVIHGVIITQIARYVPLTGNMASVRMGLKDIYGVFIAQIARYFYKCVYTTVF